MAKSKSSQRWLLEHRTDPFVKQSKADGYRSRASYKLLELNRRDRLFRPGMAVIDLGAAPGGWSQVAAASVGPAGTVIASDILPVDSIAGVEFLQGDFSEQAVLDEILTLVHSRPFDLVISDMAPNMSGVKQLDHAASMYLVELAFDLASRVLRSGGDFVTKVFHGQGFDSFLSETRKAFNRVNIRKPEASRARSREIYLVAKGFLGQP